MSCSFDTLAMRLTRAGLWRAVIVVRAVRAESADLYKRFVVVIVVGDCCQLYWVGRCRICIAVNTVCIAKLVPMWELYISPRLRHIVGTFRKY